MSASVFGPSEKQGCRAGGRSKAITQRVRSIRVRRFLTFKLCSAPRESEAGGRSEEFLEKKRRSRFRYVAGTNQVRRCYVTQTFLCLNTGHRFSGISDAGLEARVARMRGRIRGAERWTLAEWDDLHRNPDRSSRLTVLLYSSCSWLR